MQYAESGIIGGLRHHDEFVFQFVKRLHKQQNRKREKTTNRISQRKMNDCHFEI